MPGATFDGAGSIHALGAKLTKLDDTGRPATGDDNTFYTDALIKVSLGVNLNEPDAIKSTNGSGITCLIFQPPKTIDSLNVDSIAWCSNDPRILEFMVGGDIIYEGVQEVQTLSLTTGAATGGNYVLHYNGDDTTSLAHSATAAQVKTALNAIVPGGVKTTGGPTQTSPIVITFNEAEDVDLITITSSVTGTGTPAYGVATTTPGGGDEDTVIGYAAPAVGAAGKPNGVAAEFWSRRVVGGSAVGYWHWLLPRLDLALSSDGFELGADDPLQPTFTGSGAENINFGSGADGSWPHISSRVYQFYAVDALPDFAQGYASEAG